MMVTQKVTTLAFQLHDGKADLKEFSALTFATFELRMIHDNFIFQACVKIQKN